MAKAGADGEMGMIEIVGQKDVFVTSAARMIDFYLSGTIGPASEYLSWFHAIRNAGETDVVVIHINSYGGDMFTAIQLMQAVAESNATVICSVEGACMSAATLVFLAGDQYQINEFSMFMFHNYSGWTAGKGGEMFDSVSHERQWSAELLDHMYDGFLTKKEINSMLENKDIWMSSAEVVKRLTKRSEKIQAEHQAAKKKKK